jgi:hypothetical protein
MFLSGLNSFYFTAANDFFKIKIRTFSAKLHCDLDYWRKNYIILQNASNRRVTRICLDNPKISFFFYKGEKGKSFKDQKGLQLPDISNIVSKTLRE